MSSIDLYSNEFKKVGAQDFKFDFNPEDISVPAVHQVVKAILAGRRQGTACTKSKALVSGGGAKPFKQKGTGRARQGSTRSPLMPGGGTAFGPTPRDYTQKVNKKLMLKALSSIITDKKSAGALYVVDKFNSDGKTKNFYKKLAAANLLSALIITNSKDDKALIAARNIETVTALPVEGFSVYSAVKHSNLIIEKAALETLLARLV